MLIGTKFDRHEFNRMITDVRRGRINCVMVKDLLKMGRNYLEAGGYVEKLLPFFCVRFIAVTDCRLYHTRPGWSRAACKNLQH